MSSQSSFQPPFSPLPPVRILCDEMLLGLAGWLRIAGYDTQVPTPGTRDPQVVDNAYREGRWLITRDRGLLTQSRTPEVVVLLESQGLAANRHELTRRLNLDWLHAPFSRCKRCNTPLVPCADAPEPPAGTQVSFCPHCQQPFWEGSHVRRMRTQLVALNRQRL